MVNSALLSALPPLLRQVVIMSGNNCSNASLVILLMVTSPTLVSALSGDSPRLVVIVPSTCPPHPTILLPNPSCHPVLSL